MKTEKLEASCQKDDIMQKKKSFEPDSNQRPMDFSFSFYSPPLYQLSYRRVTMSLYYSVIVVYKQLFVNKKANLTQEIAKRLAEPSSPIQISDYHFL